MPRIKNETRKCSLWWCPRDAYNGVLCMRHYRSQARNGQVKMGMDARLLYSHIQRTNVLLTNLADHCWVETNGIKYCQYCGAENNHDETCIVLTASGLLALQGLV